MGQIVTHITGREKQTVEELARNQTVFVDITTPSAPGDLQRIEHSLGRIPKGYAIVDRPYRMFNHGHDATDTAWDDQFIYIRFDVTDQALGIAVF